MLPANGPGPFLPGTGRLPPYLAGREAEQSLFRQCFETLRQGKSAASELILYGPRGNGKTALLRWVEAEAEAIDGLDTCWLIGSSVPEPASLARRLELGSFLRRMQPESVSVSGFGVSFRDDSDLPLLAEGLERRARARPLLLLLDEAHTLEPGVARWLLNAARAAGSRAPFLLALAGTPDLRARLSEAGASFWNRAAKLRVGLLDENAAAAAVSRPLEAEGIGLEPEARERIVRESHGYPFFTQLWGRAVRGAIGRSPEVVRTVTAAVVDEAAAEFEAEKDDHHSDRFRELHRQGLLPAAREVAVAFRTAERLGLAALEDAVARGLEPGLEKDGPNPTAAAESLEHLGFVWQIKGAPFWEPGIPSLMDYIREYAPTPTGG